MNVKATALAEVLLIDLDVFADQRGHFFERYNEVRFTEHGLPTTFRQDNQSRSKRNVLRGLHYQLNRPQGKLVSCLRGTVFDVAADIRVGSPTFGAWVGVELTEDRPQLLWIPPGFAHGFCAMSDVAEIEYKCTDVYVPSDDRGIVWSDPELDIEWPVTRPILSDRDRGLPKLSSAHGNLPQYVAPSASHAAK